MLVATDKSQDTALDNQGEQHNTQEALLMGILH